jgi:diguanylate cyclase (GGDEF)-like protein
MMVRRIATGNRPRARAAWLAGALLLGAGGSAAAPPPAPQPAAVATCLATADAQPAAAREIAERALAALDAAADPRGAALLRRCIGHTYELGGDLPRAGQAYEAALSDAERSGDREVEADVLGLRGGLRHRSGDFEGALDDLRRAHDIYVALDRGPSVSWVLNAIANVYADAAVGDYDRAIGYYRENLERHRASGDRAEMATTLFNIGSTLERQGDLAQAMAHYQQAREIDAARGDPESVAEEDRVIGALHARLGRLDLALPLIDAALGHYRARDDADGIARTRLTRAIALNEGGRPREALAELDPVQAHFESTGNRRFLVRVHALRAAALASMSRWEEAFAARSRQAELQGEIDRALASENLSRLRVAFDLERAEAQNRALRAENAQRRAQEESAARERRLERIVTALALVLVLVLAVLGALQLRAARRFRVLALADELTGLPNRRSVLAFLRAALADAVRARRPLAVVGFDVDRFKSINDSLGHDGGDRVLRAVARLAAAALRHGDRVGRVGGEEFLLVLPGADADAAAEVAERLRSAIAGAPLPDLDPALRVSCSFGVAAAGDGEAVDDLLRRADAALYRAKSGGRNRVEVDASGGAAPAGAARSG